MASGLFFHPPQYTAVFIELRLYERLKLHCGGPPASELQKANNTNGKSGSIEGEPCDRLQAESLIPEMYSAKASGSRVD